MKGMARTLFATAGVLVFIATTASAQFANETWKMDENGPALLSGQVAGYSNGTNMLDPVSGLVGWYYPLAGASNISGDVLLLEPPVAGISNSVSDLLRFDGRGGVFFFSDLEAGELNPDHADVPVMPSARNPVVLNEIGPEGNNGALYTPLPGQPGYDLSGLLPGIQYDIISDVPEPRVAVLAVTGGLLLLNRARKFRNRSRW